MTYHLTVHNIIIPMNKKTIKLTTVCLNYDIEMLRNLKALYKYTDFEGAWERDRDTDRQADRQTDRQGRREGERENSNSKILFSKDCTLCSFRPV